MAARADERSCDKSTQSDRVNLSKPAKAHAVRKSSLFGRPNDSVGRLNGDDSVGRPNNTDFRTAWAFGSFCAEITLTLRPSSRRLLLCLPLYDAPFDVTGESGIGQQSCLLCDFSVAKFVFSFAPSLSM